MCKIRTILKIRNMELINQQNPMVNATNISFYRQDPIVRIIGYLNQHPPRVSFNLYFNKNLLFCITFLNLLLSLNLILPFLDSVLLPINIQCAWGNSFNTGNWCIFKHQIKGIYRGGASGQSPLDLQRGGCIHFNYFK